MPQIQLPIFPPDSVDINSEIAFKKEHGKVTYFNGSMPVFSHDENDIKAFRMITSQFYVNGTATQSEIAKAFGVSQISVRRAVKLYRTQGVAGFYTPKNTRGAAVLTDSVLKDVQAYLNNGASIPEAAAEFDIKPNTLGKAVGSGRLYRPVKKNSSKHCADTTSHTEHKNSTIQAG